MFNQLVKWSLEEFPELPWRKNRTLYSTLVSEIMLQQTTVQTVEKIFPKFMKTYPNIKSLASSTEDEVCIAWKGLGYYRRARNLRKAAIAINDEFKGKIPTDVETLAKIPGIGDYTANAIRAIGSDQKALAVDANLERVLSRIYGLSEKKGPALQKKLKNLFVEKDGLCEIKSQSPCEIHEALMDLGRTFCRSNSTNCLDCPVKKNCKAFKLDKVDFFPVMEKQKKKFYELDLLRALVVEKGKVLGYQKSDNEWLSGQIELPTFLLRTEDDDLRQYPSKKFSTKTKAKKSTITKYKINNYVEEITYQDFLKKVSKSKKYKFYPLDTGKINFASTTLKYVKKYLP